MNGGNNLVVGDSGQITAASTDGPQLAGLALTIGEVLTTADGIGGSDTITAGSGNDILVGGTNDEGMVETIAAGEGNNIVLGDSGRMDFTRGDRVTSPTAGADTTPADLDLVESTSTTEFGGVDKITTGSGSDLIIGGRYGDTTEAGDGNNLVLGDSGRITAANASGPQFAGLPMTLGLIETISDGNGGSDNITTGSGNDIILGGTNDANVAEVIQAGAGNNIVLGDDGYIDWTAKDANRAYAGTSTPTGGSLPGDDQVASDIDRIWSTSEGTGGIDQISAGDGNDVVIGGAADDTISVANGSNLVLGDSGQITAASVDTLAGQTTRYQQFSGVPMTFGLIVTSADDIGGADTITSGTGCDIVLGGTGNDRITASDPQYPTTVALGDNNIVLGDSGRIDYTRADRDSVPGADTNPGDIDLIESTSTTNAGGVDTTITGEGDDIVIGGREWDTIEAGAGDNLVIGDSGRVTAAIEDKDAPQFGVPMTLGLVETMSSADGGPDTITTLGGNDVILGGQAGDVMGAGDGNNIVLGDNGLLDYTRADRFTDPPVGADHNPEDVDLILSVDEGIGGSDTITTGTGNDIVLGGAFGDAINAGAGCNVALGDSGEIQAAGGDEPRFGDQPITIITLGLITSTATAVGGDDTITMLEGEDIILGGAGADSIRAGGGADIVLGDNGIVTVDAVVTKIECIEDATGGPDTIYGEGGQDVLIGGAGADRIDGGGDKDLLFADCVTLDRSGSLNDYTNLRFRTLIGTEIYGRGTSVNGFPSGEVLIGDDAQLDPDGRSAWGNFKIAIHDSGASFYPSEYMAGGAGDDTIFGGLGHDILQGDGSIDLVVAASRNDAKELVLLASVDGENDGDDYIEGGGGNDVIFGNQGQDDLIGGSSMLFSLDTSDRRPDGSDLIFGGSGTAIDRNALGDTASAGHANDADMILGDNGNIYRIVEVVNGVTQFVTFGYDYYGATAKIVVRAAELVDYTPGGPDYTMAVEVGPADVAINPHTGQRDIGAADEIHGESGDDFIFGQAGADAIFGEGQNDSIVGGYGNDWISGGSGDDGVIGDDGLVFASRNGTAEPLYGIGAIPEGGLDAFISTPGKVQQATINVTGALKYTVDLTPFNVQGTTEAQDPLFRPSYADDMIFGGLGNDTLHGGAGDDAISGAEALSESYVQHYTGADLDRVSRSDYYHPYNPGDVLRYNTTANADHYDASRRIDEFALYDEYRPLQKILLDDNGTASTTGGGYEFFLNFLANEGPLVTSASYGEKNTDGNDAIFGDLGNDWLVGGTGRDDLYGGWGNDLLNIDDDLSTSGGANDVPDTHPSYEDRAFGGAGRDVLIANTGGDRLIDWAGEFNTYLVPFAPFGLGTVSRALQPQIAEFLYALSASDGADPTRAADTGADPVRNGEPEGELGVVRQQDFAWQDQTGGPIDPQAGNIPGGSRDVLRSSDFNNGNLQAFAADSGLWTVQSGALQVSASSLHGDAVAVYDLGDTNGLPSYFEVRASISVIKPLAGWKANSYIIFDYEGPTAFKFTGIDVAIDKLVMGHRDETGWVVDKQVPFKAKPDIFYNMLLSVNGLTASLIVDNTTVFTQTYAARIVDGYSYGLNWGLVGFGSDNSQGAMDNVAVQVLPPQITYEHLDDFDDARADLFTSTSAGIWEAMNGRWMGVPALTQSFAYSTVALPGVANLQTGSHLELAVVLNAATQAGFVYDQYSDVDFKFAALDAAADRVLIGHHTARSGWVMDRVASWTIDAGMDYAVGLTLHGTTVNVTVNGQTIVSHAFNAVTVDGGFGLFTRDAATAFDDFNLRTDEPAFEQPNHAPVAQDDAASTSAGTPVTIAVLDNDQDANGDALTVSSLTQPSNGSVVVNADGTVTYTPVSGFVGTDSFSYKASDGLSLSAVATVTVQVVAIGNTAPVAASDSAATTAGMPVTIAVLANDSDADGDALAVSALGAPANGTVALNADGTVTYTPVTGFVGTDTFTYQASDGLSLSPVATVTVEVTASQSVTTTYSHSTPQAIPDRGTVLSTIVISDAYAIRDINVQLNITHTRDSDLQVFLRAPDGTVIELFRNVGGSGQNFTGTVLDDEAGTLISAGTAPFAGTYRPTGDLSQLEGKSVTGTWTLEIRDTAKKQTGTLNGWSITIEH
ncbi:MAG TPA: Ig-like domain-containing protein [Verrucomicrobiota bacterium]|nr:Ig-like domain-containing protein [Verrucomicrobiota bacterium]